MVHVHLHVLTYIHTVHVQWIKNLKARVRQMSVDEIPKRFSPGRQCTNL